MKTSISQYEFVKWQDAFHSYWSGNNYDYRVLLSGFFPKRNYLDTGAVFSILAGSSSPSAIRKITLNKAILVDINHEGFFAALEDQFIVVQGSHIYKFPYEHCDAAEIGWIKQKIFAKVHFKNQGVLTLLINAWVPRNIFQRLLNDDVIDMLEDENEMALGLILRPLQGVVGKDVDPRTVERYEQLRQILASFLRFIIN